MDNNAFINLKNGLGDKIMDLIGFCVICEYLNYKPHINFNNNISNFQWGNSHYDIKLFNFDNVNIINDNNYTYYINSHPSLSLCPYRVYEYLTQFFSTINFEEVSYKYNQFAKKLIKPSDIILSKIPINIENAYGIHLRRSDKVNNRCDITHENTIDEFNLITNKLLEDIQSIILTENEPSFLIVSEDIEWKNHIKDIINNYSLINNKKINILEIDYTNNNNYHNYASVLDMFCLSKCKEIFQGVKYSTFSILASILGDINLRNYSKHLQSDNKCCVYAWNSIATINNNKNYDIEVHKKAIDFFPNFNTNIRGIFK
jgi:hypothetical protein